MCQVQWHSWHLSLLPPLQTRGIIKQHHFDGVGCNVGTLMAVSQEIEVGMNGKEKPSGLETPPGSFLGQ